MSSPPPDELLRRLRAIYCHDRGLTYEQYDQLVAEERITFQELTELVEVLFTQVQYMGLSDFLFQEEAAQRKADKERLAEIQASLKRIGSSPALKERYAGVVQELIDEGNEIKSRLS